MKKQILWSILTFIILAIISFAIILISYGLLNKVTFNEKELGPYKLCAVEQKGDYKLAKEIAKNSYNALKNIDIDSTIGIGVYFDDPKTTPKEECNFIFGSVIPEEKILTEEELKYLTEKSGFIIKEIPRQKYLITTFKWGNSKFIPLMIAMIKGYPAISKEIDTKGYKQRELLEIYDMKEKGKETFSILLPLEDK